MPIDHDTFEQFKSTVSRFVAEQLVPREDEVERDDKIPEDVRDSMKEMGLFGLTIPEQYGGLGLNVSQEVEIGMILGRTSPAFRSVVGTNIGIGSQGIVIDGTEQQKQSFLPAMARGDVIGAFCLTEPDHGSDAAGLKTRADKASDGYVINGTKRYITNAASADVLTVMARTDQAQPGGRGVSAFIVDAKSAGVNIGPPERKMGQRGAHIHDVTFEDCKVPADAIIGGVEGQGFKTAMKTLDRGRIHISSVCVGVAGRIIGDAVRYARDRQQFGKPIAEFQLIQAMLADSETEYQAAKALVQQCAQARDNGDAVTKLASICKYYCSEMVGRVADRAVQIHGGAGYVADYQIERFYRDVRLFRLYEGTSQIQQLIIARELMKEHE